MSLDGFLRCASLVFVVLSGLRPADAQLLPSTNDTCSTARVLSAFDSQYTELVDGRTANHDIDVACNDPVSPSLRNGVWYTVTPANDIVMRFYIESQTENYATQVFAGSCDALVPVACATDAAIVRLSAGVQYWVLTGHVQPPSANVFETFLIYRVRVAFGPAAPNDSCEAATALSPGTQYTLPNQFAFTDTIAPCTTFESFQGVFRSAVWVTYTPPRSGIYRFRLVSGGASVLHYQGSCDALERKSCSISTDRAHALQAGQSYYWLIGRSPGSVWNTQDYVVQLERIGPAPNADCEHAAPLVTDGTTVTVDARGDPSVAAFSCGVTSATVWYTFIPSSRARFIFRPGGGEQMLALYTSDTGCESLTEVFCDPDRYSSEFVVDAGRRYWLRVGGPAEQPPFARYQFKVFLKAIPPNDTCSTATTVSTFPLIESIDTFGAGKDGLRNCGTRSDPVWYGIWYRFVAAQSGVLSVYGSDLVSSFTGQSCELLTEQPCHFYRYAQVPVVSGQEYWLRLGTSNESDDGSGMDFALRLFPHAVNDICENAIRVSEFPFVATPPGPSATRDEVPQCTNDYLAYGVWYTVVPPRAGILTVDDASFDRVRTWVYSGRCGSLTPLSCSAVNAPSETVVSPGAPVYILVGTSNEAYRPESPYLVHFNLLHTPCQIADFDSSGLVSPTDIFLFLDAWFAQRDSSGAGLSADADGSGVVNVQDVFYFLTHWFNFNGQAC